MNRLPPIRYRTAGTKYLYQHRIVIWDGNMLRCEHNRQRPNCKDCCGSQICEHRRIKSQCKYCNGSQICEHRRIRSQCIDCGGSQICQHQKQK